MALTNRWTSTRRISALAVLVCAVPGAFNACSHLASDDRAAATAEPARSIAPPPPDPVGRVFISERAPLSPEEALKSFSVPPGFEIQLVAAEPALQKPMQLAFDERGRLLVSTSTNYPLGPPKDGPPSDRVLIIED
jgi:hypothetical protein